jgi:predicted enzyme related to lactoylglutathione lyase
MAIRLAAIVLDAADIETESRFWHRLLGGELEEKERHHILRVAGSPVLAIQLAPGHVPPQWPAGQPQQLHIDLAVDDIEPAHRQAVEAGARVLTPPDDLDAIAESGEIWRSDRQISPLLRGGRGGRGSQDSSGLRWPRGTCGMIASGGMMPSRPDW